MKRILIAILAAALLTPAMPAQAGVSSEASIPAPAKKKTETVTFKTSIHCQKCVRKVTDNISFEKGVKDLKVNLEEKLVTITFDPSKTSAEALGKALKKLGYEAEMVKGAQS